jgi:hypothetical protein
LLNLSIEERLPDFVEFSIFICFRRRLELMGILERGYSKEEYALAVFLLELGTSILARQTLPYEVFSVCRNVRVA